MSEPTYLQSIRTAYDTVAVGYAELLRTELDNRPVDRGLLAAFADLVKLADLGPVADLGCGPGRVTAYLAALGVPVFGVDLSPGMVAVARRTYPDLSFDVGSMTGLDLADETLGGIIAWYSIIHTPPELMPVVFAEFHRMLRPGGELMMAFQVGDERVHIAQGYGHAVSLDAYRWRPDRVAEELAQAGLDVHTRAVREPGEREKVPQAYLLARKPPRSSPVADTDQPG